MNNYQSKLKVFRNPSYLQSSISMLVFFASWGIWWSFYQLWLTSKTNGLGLSGSQVGSIFAINSLVSLVLMFVYGTIQDKLFIKRNLLIFNAIISTLIGPFFIWVYAPLLLNHFMIGVWIGAVVLSTGFLSAVGILEAVTERFSRVFSFEYGQARAWGSFGYAIVALLAGIFFVINPHLNFWFGSLFGLLLLLILLFWVPKEEKAANIAIKNLTRDGAIPKLSDMIGLLKMSELWQVIIFIMFTWTFYNIFDSQMFPDFYTKLFKNASVGQQTYGTLNSIQVFFEAIMLGIVPIIMKRIGVKKTLMIGVGIMFIRIGLCGFNSNPYVVSAIKMLHSLEVPMFTLSIFRYFTLHFNTKLSASLYMIGFQIAAQIGQVILSTPLGILRDAVGYQNTFHVIAAIVLIAGVYAFFILKKDSDHIEGTPLQKK